MTISLHLHMHAQDQTKMSEPTKYQTKQNEQTASRQDVNVVYSLTF